MLPLGVSVKSSKFWYITRIFPCITDFQSGMWLHWKFNKIKHNIRLHDKMVNKGKIID